MKALTAVIFLTAFLQVVEGQSTTNHHHRKRYIRYYPSYSKPTEETNGKRRGDVPIEERPQTLEESINAFRELVLKIHGRPRIWYRQPEGIIPNQKRKRRRRNKKRRRYNETAQKEHLRNKEKVPENGDPFFSITKSPDEFQNKSAELNLDNSQLTVNQTKGNSSEKLLTPEYSGPVFISQATIISRISSKGNYVETLLVKGSDTEPFIVSPGNKVRNKRMLRKLRKMRRKARRRRQRKRQQAKLRKQAQLELKAKSSGSSSVMNDAGYRRRRGRRHRQRRRRGTITGGVLNIYDFPRRAHIGRPTILVRVYKPGRRFPYAERVLIRGSNGLPYRPTRHIPQMHRKRWVIPTLASDTRTFTYDTPITNKNDN